ncbi:MAG: LCP family protein [Chloroflexota bacterium]
MNRAKSNSNESHPPNPINIPQDALTPPPRRDQITLPDLPVVLPPPPTQHTTQMHQTQMHQTTGSSTIKNVLSTLQKNRFAGFATAYSVCILLLALLIGPQLYRWANQSVTQSSPSLYLTSYFSTQPEATPTETGAGIEQSPVVQPIFEPQDAAELSEFAKANPVINILLLGIDTRRKSSELTLTDTMLLLTLDLQSQTAGMLSFPRDLWVPIPAYDMTTKINLAYSIGEQRRYPGGGEALAKETISNFIGREVHYFARVNFDGFIEMIDLIDGVEVIVPYTIEDFHYPTADFGVERFYIEAGTQHLDGETALKFARTRNVDNDYGRARRQQQIIRAVADKVLRADMIPKLVPKIPRAMLTMRKSFETDMPLATMFELASYFHQASMKEIRQLVLDSSYGTESFSDEGAWILIPDRAKVRVALNEFFEPTQVDAVTQADNGPQASATPGWVRLEILNGTGRPGVAGEIRTQLSALGWQVVYIDVADRSDYKDTVLVNYGIDDIWVDKIKQDLGLPSNLPSITGINQSAPIDIRVVVGRDMLDTLALK